MRQSGKYARKDGRDLEARGGAQKNAGKSDANLRSGNQSIRLIQKTEHFFCAWVSNIREMLHPAFPALNERRFYLSEEGVQKNASYKQQT